MSAILSIFPIVAALGLGASGISWETSLDAALERAKKESLPVFIGVHSHGEPASDWTAAEVYNDREIGKLSRRTVNVISLNLGPKPDTKRISRFGGLDEKVYRSIEADVRQRIVRPEGEGHVIVPQHIFLHPDGKVILSVPYVITADELQWCFVRAIRSVDPASAVNMPDTARPPARLVMGDIHHPGAREIENPTDNAKVWAPRPQPLARRELAELLKNIKRDYTALYDPGNHLRIVSTDHSDAIEFASRHLTYLNHDYGGPSAQAALIRTIGLVSPPSYWKVLKPYAKSDEPSIRAEVAVALEQLGSPSSCRMAQGAYGRERDATVKNAWIRAIGATGRGDSSARKTIIKAAKSSKIEAVRANATVALGSLAYHADVETTLLALLDEENARLRVAAACGMALTRDPRYSKPLRDRIARSAGTDEATDLQAALDVVDGAGLRRLEKLVTKTCEDSISRKRIFAALDH